MPFPNDYPYYPKKLTPGSKAQTSDAKWSGVVALPEHLARLPIDVLDLSVRSHNALRYRTKTVGDLALCSDDKLLKINNLGRKSVVDVHRALTEFMDKHAEEIAAESNGHSKDQADTQPNASAEMVFSGGWRVPDKLRMRKYGLLRVSVNEVLASPIEILDLSARSMNALVKLRILSISELLSYSRVVLFKAKNVGRRSVNEIESKLFAYLSGGQVPGDGAGTADQESAKSQGTRAFVSHMLSLVTERQSAVIADRYGLWDGIFETLQDIGDKLGLTRERIRQIEAKGLKRLRRVYGYGAIKDLVVAKLAAYLTIHNDTTQGVMSKEEIEIVFADDCSTEEATLAISLLQDLNVGSFMQQLVEAEPGGSVPIPVEK